MLVTEKRTRSPEASAAEKQRRLDQHHRIIGKVLDTLVLREMIAAMLLSEDESSSYCPPISPTDINVLHTYGIVRLDGTFTPRGRLLLRDVEVDADALANDRLDLVVHARSE